MQNVDYSSTASTDEKRDRRERERGELHSCQERGICDRSRVVPNAGVKAWGLGEFLPPDPMCLL